MRRSNWSVALALLFAALLAWYILYTERIVQALRANAEDFSQIYSRVQEGIGDPTPGAAETTLFELQGIIRESGVPLIWTGPGDTVLAAENLPFQADLNIPTDQSRVRTYARRLDLRNPPMGDSSLLLLHFGDPPQVRLLQWIRWFQVGGFLLTAMLGVLVIRVQRRAEGERAWIAMARELAHQLGTPISSLQGWLELMRLPERDRPPGLKRGEIADEIGADVARLEKISHRFELIGREPSLEEVDLAGILVGLRAYLAVRIPRFTSGVQLELDVPPDLPKVMGNEVLLTWALENLVNNALDAVKGKGGRIRIRARAGAGKHVVITISDTGPGVAPHVRNQLFDPGVTTKPRGWGVGLTLARRIVEGVHGGRIGLTDSELGGATFGIRLPRTRVKGE